MKKTYTVRRSNVPDGIQNEIKRGSYKYRSMLAQVLASLGNAAQYCSLGAAVNFNAVVVAGLMLQEDIIIKTTDNELSLIGSVCFVMQAIGNILGGLSMALFGRKWAMFLGNFPYIIGWLLLWQSPNLQVLILGNAFLGLGTGLLCPPMVSYTGEVVQPGLSAMLTCLSDVLAGVGACSVFALAAMLGWRTTALIYLGEAIFAALVVIMLPESPIWLMSKGRDDDALDSLCWLRGWVNPEEVKVEFEELMAQNKRNSRCRKCESIGINSHENPDKCGHANQTFCARIKTRLLNFSPRNAVRPSILACIFFFFSAMTSICWIKPTILNILTAFYMPINARWTAIGVGFLAVFGGILIMTLVRFVGKRPLVIGSMVGSCACTALLGLYVQHTLPPESNSYLEITSIPRDTSTGPLALFIIMIFCNMFGFFSVSWMIVSEIFPSDVSGLSCGIIGAMYDIVLFITAVTYIDIENAFHIYGALYFHAGFTVLGIIFLYLFLLEMDGKTRKQKGENFAVKNMVYANGMITRGAGNIKFENYARPREIYVSTVINDI